MSTSMRKAILAMLILASSSLPLLAQEGRMYQPGGGFGGYGGYGGNGQFQQPNPAPWGSLDGTDWVGPEHGLQLSFHGPNCVRLTDNGGGTWGTYTMQGGQVIMRFPELQRTFVGNLNMPIRPGATMSGLVLGRDPCSFSVTMMGRCEFPGGGFEPLDELNPFPLPKPQPIPLPSFDPSLRFQPNGPSGVPNFGPQVPNFGPQGPNFGPQGPNGSQWPNFGPQGPNRGPSGPPSPLPPSSSHNPLQPLPK